MSVESLVEVVWWVGLLGALGLTAVAVKLLSELLRTLDHLRELTEWIATAADGLANALSEPLRLVEAAEAAEGVRLGATAVQQSAERMRVAVGGERKREEQRNAEPAGGGEGAGELGGAAGGPGTGGGEES